MAKYTVRDLFHVHASFLGLKLVAGSSFLNRSIEIPEVQRPGLSLSGYLKRFVNKRILIFGKLETLYLKDLDPKIQKDRLLRILPKIPAVIVARKAPVPRQLLEVCKQLRIPLFKTDLDTMNLFSKLVLVLGEAFSPRMTCHGTLVEAFGVGVLIQGDSSVGKSEAALGLIERGHRLVADDIVRVQVKEGSHLEGSGPELTRHLMEIRGIGIINVAHLYGAVCVRESKRVDVIVKLEEWQEGVSYDRIGGGNTTTTILGVTLPYHLLPVKSGRDVSLLIETIVLNHRLREMGYNTAKEFNAKLHEAIARKQKMVQNRKKLSSVKVREKSYSES